MFMTVAVATFHNRGLFWGKTVILHHHSSPMWVANSRICSPWQAMATRDAGKVRKGLKRKSIEYYRWHGAQLVLEMKKKLK
jgi:hypothetical protein